MTPLPVARKATAALLVGAFALSACGGGSPTAAPSTAAGTPVAPSTAATTPPASQSVVTLPPGTEPPATGGPAVDPADDLKIAAPYTLEPLDAQIASIFVQAMEQSLTGPMANVVQFGFRTASKDGATQAWVIVMGFPGIPIGGTAVLDQIVAAATSGGGTVEDLKISGKDARLVEQGGQAFVIMVIGDELLMIVGQAKKATVDTAKAIGEAN